MRQVCCLLLLLPLYMPKTKNSNSFITMLKKFDTPSSKSLSMFIWCVLLLSISLMAETVGSLSCDNGDMQALLRFKVMVSSSRPLNWTEERNCMSWEGLVWKDGKVIKMWLPARGLTGALSISLGSLGSLGHLKELNISHNKFVGPVPTEVFLLGNLQVLDLSYNNFSGALPSLGSLPSIQFLDVSSNYFSERLLLLGGLPHLKVFNVSNNTFSGPIPIELCRNSSLLGVADFSFNMFEGRLREGIEQCKILKEFSLGFNNLIGPLPEVVFNLTSLTKLSAPNNKLSGSLDANIGKLRNLTVLSLFGNGFTGLLPVELGTLVKIVEIDLHNNGFGGELPESLSSLKSLQLLNLRNNSFSGNITLDFSELSKLASLDLSSNGFTGLFPSSLSSCTKLRSLSLAKNKLKGRIPESIASLKSLGFLSLSNNSLSDIREALHTLQGLNNLSIIILTKNFHEEPIPEDVEGFDGLQVLALGNCALSGRFPAWLKKCLRLKVLDLSWNNLSGSIPPWIGGFQYLFYVDISNNSFTGEIPVEITRLPSLASKQSLSDIDQASFDQPLFVKHNQSTSGLQYNQLTFFPPSLYLSRNKFTGRISPEFGRMQMLLVLDLKNNSLSGGIPAELSNMTNLENLDLSDNNLTGPIPRSLQDLTFLSKFNVADNHLYGVIPSGRQFNTFPASSFLGNPDLCGSPLPECKSASSNPVMRLTHVKRLNRKAIAGIAVSVGGGLAIILALVLWSISRRHMKIDEEASEVDYITSHRSSDASESSLLLIFQNNGLKDLAIADIFKATNNFDQANIIGCGGFGLVYKATLSNGTKVAIKKLTGDCGQMEREFRAEVEVLSRARHKNLVSLLGYCRYGNCRLLIYSYLENGSLDYWLHENPEGGSVLDWPARLKIAQGASKGLAYMHAIDPHIVHRDIKSSNILLDDSFEGYVADFGLSRLILPYDTHVTTELVGTLGYIPPEYGQSWVATLRGDVYSFGVVILELLTKRRPVEVCKPKIGDDLVTWVHQMRVEGKQEDVFDHFLCGKGYKEQMLQVLDVACMCTNENPCKRPTIQQAVDWLDSVGIEN